MRVGYPQLLAESLPCVDLSEAETRLQTQVLSSLLQDAAAAELWGGCHCLHVRKLVCPSQ